MEDGSYDEDLERQQEETKELQRNAAWDMVRESRAKDDLIMMKDAIPTPTGWGGGS